MNTNKLRWPAAAAVLSLIGVSCADPINSIAYEDWSPAVAAPVLNTSFTLRDVLQGTEFSDQIDESAEGALVVQLSQKLFDVQPGLNLDFTRIVLPMADTVNSYSVQDLELPAAVTRVDLGEGVVEITMVNDQAEFVDVVVSIPSLTIGGRPFRHVLTLPPLIQVTDSVAINSAQLAADDAGHYNLGYTAITAIGNESVQLPAAGVLLRTEGYTYAEGTFDGLAFDLSSDSLAFDALNVFEEGSIAFVAPKFTITASNEVGVPLSILNDSTFAVSRRDETHYLRSALDAGFDIDYPKTFESDSTQLSSLIIDSASSNLVILINLLPTQFSFGLIGSSRASEPGERYSIRPEARLSAEVDFEMPIKARFSSFQLGETFVLDGSSLVDATAASFHLEVDNGFSLAAAAQVYFFDSADALIDSLFATPTIIAAAPVLTTTGQVEYSEPLRTVIELDEAVIQKMSSTRSARVALRLDSPTTGDQTTTLHYDDYMAVRLGVQVDVTPPIEE